MNYRQWKKHYKKVHGYNPPLADNKRQQLKLLKKTLRQAKHINIPELAKGIVNALSNAFVIIGEAFTNVGKSIYISDKKS